MEEAASTFDELVSGISAEERTTLLSKINGNKQPEVLILQAEKADTTVSYGLVNTKYESESIFYKILLWIRSFITKREVKEIYEEDLIETIVKRINKDFPGLIDFHNKLFLSLFYEKLKELKSCADFFRPYFVYMNENPGRFYVFLSTFLSPEISEKINIEADPYTIPFDREATNDARSSLLRQMDDILRNIESASRGRLYSAIQSLNWLRQFSSLPFIHWTAQFTSLISNSYTCPFSNSMADFPTFAKVLHEASSISKDALQALFLYPYRHSIHNGGLDTESEKKLNEFIAKSASCISIIQSFITTVPLNLLGKVVFEDYSWHCAPYSGGEDWFIKFKDEWKDVFEKRWASWLRDRKKSQLSSVLLRTFSLNEFPELPYRPWADVWGGVHFNCEMTAGFLWWFAKNTYNETMPVLNTVLLDGLFINKNNRSELSTAVNDFASANQQILLLADSLEKNGSVGSIFQKIIDEKTRTIQAQKSIDSLIATTEKSVHDYSKLFCGAVRSIERVFHGILDDDKEKGYDTLQNLMVLKGRDNQEFRDKMTQARTTLNVAKSILAEIEPLDMPRS